MLIIFFEIPDLACQSFPSAFFPIHINVFREAVADGAVAVSVA